MMAKKVLVQGSTAGAVRAAENLADCGLSVNLVEPGPFIAAGVASETPPYLQNASLLRLLKDPRITSWTNTEVHQVEWGPASCRVVLSQSPRYIDLSRCTACGKCLEACPVTLPGTSRKAIHLGGQPDCAVISKAGAAPCANSCPAGIPVQGYIALANEGRYQEAYQLIHDALPFPSVCGRVCNHYCEDNCSRLKMDDPVNIMGLKRFLSDWALGKGVENSQGKAEARYRPLQQDEGKRVAIIGAGPAGLTAARDLVRAGYSAKVFDNNPRAGGMMRVGIPPHRLPYDHLDLEIEQVVAEGVELQLNTWIEDIPGLLESGYAAVLIATGAHKALKVPLENADHPDNWLSLEFLKKVCLGEKINLKGRKVIVLGGGDVAMDSARSAIRLGNPEVSIVCRGLRASFNEIKEAEEEGVEIIRSRVFKKVILEKGKIAGVECLEAEVGEVVNGKRQFSELSGTEHLIPGDLIIWAIGQRPEFSFLPEGGQAIEHSQGGIMADAHYMTSLEGVFTAGDVRRGTTFFVVDAVGEGHHAARSIMDYLEGIQSPTGKDQPRVVELSQAEVQRRWDLRRGAGADRTAVRCIPVDQRENSFAEVELTMTEKEARLEAGRCLSCGPCSECQACVDVCEAGAVIHSEEVSTSTIEIMGLISTREIKPDKSVEYLTLLREDEPLAGAAAAFEILQTALDPDPPAAQPALTVGISDHDAGLIVCQCSGELSKHIDTAGLCEEAAKWPEISSALEIPSACSPQGAAQIRGFIQENAPGRLILAACSCCSLDQVCYSCTYQRVRCKGNLGAYQHTLGEVDFVNIREGSAYLYPRSRKKATQAARTLIGAALGREPVRYSQNELLPGPPPSTIVIGNGAAGGICQTSLESLGYEVQALPVLSGEVIRRGGKYLASGPEGELQADCLVLAPSSVAELDFISREFFSADQSPKLAGDLSESARRLGIFICPPILEAEIGGKGAAGEVLAWAGRTRRRAQHPAAQVDALLCRNCGTCLAVCGLGVPALVSAPSGSRAWIDPRLCQDCGTCAAHCPSGAIQPGTVTDLELEATLERVLR